MEASLTAGALAMLGSALAHAGMTLLTKRAKDRLVFRALSLVFVAALMLPWLVFQPIPGWEVWRFLLLGAATIWAFNMLLIAAFERGEMNLVYPVMRGSAPALATLAAYIFLDEAVSLWQLLGLAIASSALVGFAWPEKDGTPKTQILLFALAAACMTACYTVIDAAGVRASGNVMVYTGWFFVLSGLTIGATAIIRRGSRFWAAARQETRPAATSMLFNLTTYGLALYAYSIAPVAPMAALRETSIVFGALLAALVLKEPFGLKRIALAVLLVTGLVVMQTL
ncbi:DMT family transporter [Maricaulis salignorans]|uniref:EamA-like transporter family protein n=1 Tax=Maricaulis salignorans TaxID=144026 RepID=A0A1G9LGL0_9PROT|nr:DMT family transporter [Maricaulis salignorans]SDL60937.1 EamA-like transporter family protein [Maricaulis salignorans]